MKIVATSNFDDALVADWLVADGIKDNVFAEVIARALNNEFTDDHSIYYYVAKPDNYKLRRGIEDLV